MLIKKHHFIVVFIIVLFNLCLNEDPQAIECKNARTHDEKIICSSESLKNYDAAMSKIYNASLKELNEENKQKLFADQKSWLEKRGQKKDESELMDLYIERVRGLCKKYESTCKTMSNQSIEKWVEQVKMQRHHVKLNTIDSIIMASYLKGNMNQFLQNKKTLDEVEDDMHSGNNSTSLNEVDLTHLEDESVQVILPLFMGAYQGRSMSFVNENHNFRVLSLPKFEEGKLVNYFTHSNYADWFKDEFIVHDRTQGYLYECGDTEYYKFDQGVFRLVEQTRTDCTEQELESIEKGKLTPEELKSAVIYHSIYSNKKRVVTYPRKKMDE